MSPTSSYPTQTSPVTCGIAALAAVAARTRFPDYARAPLTEVAEAQAHLHRVASHTGLPWPRRLGTAPWALAKLAGKLTGERYVTRVWASSNNLRSLRNHSPRRNQAFHAVLRSVEANKDCFLYVGGPQGKRLQRWIPRHVVVVLGAESDEATLKVFEPSSGRVFAVPAEVLLAPSGTARPEFGNWCYPLLAIVPC